MSGEDVVKIYEQLEVQGIKIWIDGGWAVDALLGELTRDHNDLDIAVEHKDLESLQKLLEVDGYKSVSREENRMWNLVLVNYEGKEIEVHAFSVDSEGKIIEEEYWNGYSEDSLAGVGTIADREVRCVSLAQLVKTHNKNKRQLKDTDLKDMEQLSKKFGVTFP